jgi:hypothetical protein
MDGRNSKIGPHGLPGITAGTMPTVTLTQEWPVQIDYVEQYYQVHVSSVDVAEYFADAYRELEQHLIDRIRRGYTL